MVGPGMPFSMCHTFTHYYWQKYWFDLQKILELKRKNILLRHFQIIVVNFKSLMQKYETDNELINMKLIMETIQ